MLLGSIVFIVMQVYFDMKIPELLARALDVANDTTVSMEQGVIHIRSVAGMMAVYVLISFALSAISSIIIARAVMSFVTKLRQDVFCKVQAMAVPDVDGFTVPGLITRSTSDIMNVQTFIMVGFQAVIKTPVISVWALAKIGSFGRSWQLTVMVAIVAAVVLIVGSILLEVPQIIKAQKCRDELNRSVMEKLEGVDVIRAYNAEGTLNSRFEGINERFSRALKFSQLPSAVVMPGINAVLYIVSIVIYLVAVNEINAIQGPGQLEIVSDMVAFIPYTAQLLLAFIMVVQVMMLYLGARVSTGRILQLLETQPSVRDEGSLNSASESSGKAGGKVEFKNISFNYHDTDRSFIRDLSFTCEPGSTTAIIGAIGSGKTTIINLLMRFYDVDSGEILLDGVNIRNFSLNGLRDKLSLTAQKALLFTGTVEENVLYGNDERKGLYDIVQICDIAGARDFVEACENKYQTMVMKHGANFSGGQRQRLSIARCLSKPCEILIFDDSFSALDFKTERTVRKKIMEKFDGITKIIVSQRINSILDADQIIVMNNGSIAGIGTHESLLRECRDYQEIYASQNRDEDGKNNRLKEEGHA